MREFVVFIIIVCLFGYQRAQTTTLVIDNFEVPQPALIIVSTTSFPSILFSTEETASTDILGNERDLQLTMTVGNPSVISTAGVNSDTFTTSIGKGGEGYALLQYDGVDGSMNLNTTGLTSVPGASLGLNLFSKGGTMFNLTYISNYDINGAIYVYDVDSGVSYLSLTFPATNNKLSTIFGAFDDFEGFCDLSKVGAIEFFFDVADFNEFLLYQITIITSANTPPPPPPPPSSSCILLIDDFTVSQDSIIVEATTTLFPVSMSNYQEDDSQAHILGGERDMQITLTSGNYYLSAGCGVGSQFKYQTPNKLNGYSFLQYDGKDQSINLNITGFTSIPGASNGLDLTNNNGSIFNITLTSSDNDFGMEVYVYDVNGGTCINHINMEVNNKPINVLLYFSDFTGNCIFQQVGAIELYFIADGEVDMGVSQFCID